MCKVPDKSSPPANQHPMFYGPDALPVAQPTVSEHFSAQLPLQNSDDKILNDSVKHMGKKIRIFY